MDVNFGGIVPLSTVDWRGRSSVVVFFNGCVFRCPYCQNFENITEKNFVDTAHVWEKIRASIGFARALVFLGGEPTMQPEALIDLAARAKEAGLAVGVHSNGFFPDAIASLIELSLADKFFIDVKAPLKVGFYEKVAGLPDISRIPGGLPDAVERIRIAIGRIDESPAELELRTTVFRDFVGEVDDIRKIAADILSLVRNPGKVSYVIQQGIGRNSADPDFQKKADLDRDALICLGEAASDVFGGTIPVFIRTADNGQEKVG